MCGVFVWHVCFVVCFVMCVYCVCGMWCVYCVCVMCGMWCVCYVCVLCICSVWCMCVFVMCVCVCLWCVCVLCGVAAAVLNAAGQGGSLGFSDRGGGLPTHCPPIPSLLCLHPLTVIVLEKPCESSDEELPHPHLGIWSLLNG